MQSFSDAEVARYLALAREVGSVRSLCDLHVHLTDVFDARPPRDDEGLEAAEFTGPAGFRVLSLREQEDVPLAARNQVSRMLTRQSYERLAALDLRKQMQVTGISAALALPVAHPEGDLEAQMLYLSKCRERHPELMLGYTIAARESVPPDQLAAQISRAKALHGVKAVKLHNNISRIDLSTDRGRRHMNAVIEACGSVGLPLIVHGGASPILAPDPCCDFGRLQQLAKLDWEPAATVIIAHCGIYGCTRSEVDDCIPLLKRLVTRPNIFVDMSGLGSEALQIVIRAIGIERMLFGSDALYHPLWRAMVAALDAFHRVGLSEADALSQVANETPSAVLDLRQPGSRSVTAPAQS
jgi:predicted TIM-barrel fold metal-dependent hydrolase